MQLPEDYSFDLDKLINVFAGYLRQFSFQANESLVFMEWTSFKEKIRNDLDSQMRLRKIEELWE